MKVKPILIIFCLKMKHFLAIASLVLTNFILYAQTQLDIQGDSSGVDTVARITVNSSGPGHVTGLRIISFPGHSDGVGLYSSGGYRGIIGTSNSGFGVHGESTSSLGVFGKSTDGPGIQGVSNTSAGAVGFSNSHYGVWGDSYSSTAVYGNSISGMGVHGKSDNNLGVYGESVTDFGVEGESEDSYGVYGHSIDSRGVYGLSVNGWGVYGYSFNSHGAVFRGDGADGFADIVLQGTNYVGGGDDGVIASDPAHASSDIIMVTNDAFIVKLNSDGNVETSNFEIWDEANDEIFNVHDNGDVYINGGLVHSSDINRKENITEVSCSNIIEAIAEMPVYEWQFKNNPRRHIGPMAQDFHAAFGLGDDNTTIAALDSDGVALAAIKALYEELESEKKANRKQQQLIDDLIRKVEKLESR